jgi:DNA invertase Pin-like site-specific DNA recombinase
MPFDDPSSPGRGVTRNLALQRDALAEAGCGRIFTEQLSGAVADRPALRDALEYIHGGFAKRY